MRDGVRVTWSKLASLVVAVPVSVCQAAPPVPVARGQAPRSAYRAKIMPLARVAAAAGDMETASVHHPEGGAREVSRSNIEFVLNGQPDAVPLFNTLPDS